MSKLFISYRHSDTGAYAPRLAERLRAFQFEAVFLDRDDISLAHDFAEGIRRGLGHSAALLVLIGQSWLEAKDETGKRRLDDPKDWVRREIVIASNLQLPLLPVLFDGARIPAIADLPEDIALLAAKKGYDVSTEYFERDADDLGRRIETMLVVAIRDASRAAVVATARGFMRCLLALWLILSFVTGAAAAAPSYIPALPQMFWVFPSAMAVMAFAWWLYLMGESQRPLRAGAS